MAKKKEQQQPLEEGILKAMRALDSQIARRMQRTPTEREAEGVQKWAPYALKVEELTALMMNALGDEEITLDSILVFSQALTKALKLIIEDLESDGLGQIRSGYCQATLEKITRDCEDGLSVIKGETITTSNRLN